MRTVIDHLVWATNDLDQLVADVTQRIGVSPRPGGRHVGRGTRNALLGLGVGRYLELLGPDPGQPEPEQPRPFAVDRLSTPALVGWAVRTADVRSLVAESRAAGYDPGEPRRMSRQSDGVVVRWLLTPPEGGYDGVVPFVIDWLDSTHPSRGLPPVELVSLTLLHPRPEAVAEALDALRLTPRDDVHVEHSDTPGLRAVIDTPQGVVMIGGPAVR